MLSYKNIIGNLVIFGVFLVALSFSTDVTFDGIVYGASTQGSQSVSLTHQTEQCISKSGQVSGTIYARGIDCSNPGDYDRKSTALTTVIYDGEVRKGGILIQSSDVLNDGDTLTVKLIENASYFATGGSFDSPPAFWVDALNSGAHATFYHDVCVPGFNSGYINTYKLWESQKEFPEENNDGFYFVFIKKPSVALQANGLSCGALVATEIGSGVRELNTICNVNSTGPVATLAAIFDETHVSDAGFLARPFMGKSAEWQKNDQKGAVYDLRNAGSLASARLDWSFDVTTASNEPDLVVSSGSVTFSQPTKKFSLFNIAHALVAGSPVNFTGLVTNIGGAVAGPSQTRLRIDVGNNGWTVGEPQFTASTAAIAPAGVKAETWSGVWTPTSGTHSFELCADSNNQVTESNEGNNCVSQTFTVPPFGGGAGVNCLINPGCPGGSGCANPALCPVVPVAPVASQLGSDTGFFCPSHQVQLSWTYSDPNNDPQSSFRAQVDDNAGFSSMIMDVYKDTADKLYITPADILALGTKYYFRVAVKDSTGAWSNWSQTADFTTPANCAPTPDFLLNSSGNISVNVTGAGSAVSNATKITATPLNGFASSIDLSVQSVLPALAGATFSFVDPPSPNQRLTPAEYNSGSVFKVTVPGTTAPGNYAITIQGQGASLTKMVTLILQVKSVSPEFQEI